MPGDSPADFAVSPRALPRLRWTRLWPLGLLLVAYSADFHFDVRGRDTFSWMDPWEYYTYACALYQGQVSAAELPLPSIFPYFQYPMIAVDSGIPASLWINVLFAGVLLVAIHVLSHQLELKTPSVVIGTVVLACPLLLGLSRELYVEFSLTAIVALQYVLWLECFERERSQWAIPFMLLLVFGQMTKMTYPLFFIAPFFLRATVLVRHKQWLSALSLVAMFALPVLFALLVEAHFFPTAFSYYLSLGFTTLPVMPLIGPRQVFSFDSVTYYSRHVGITMLAGVAAFLALPLLRTGRLRRCLDDVEARRDLLLWLWLVGPLVILILQPVKEPRHVAPCTVPAVLLVFRGIEGLGRARLRHAVLTMLLVVALAQYAAVTWGLVYCPYFLDHNVHVAEIDNAVLGSRGVSGEDKHLSIRDKYAQNVAIAGFEPNSALALAWYFHPGVVYDLDLPADDRRMFDTPLAEFEDLYTYTAFNIYNWRCRWPAYYQTLDREDVIWNADYIVVKGRSRGQAAREYPGHRVIGLERASDGPIVVLQNRRIATESYRTVYARRFLERNANLSDRELATIHKEMAMASYYRANRPSADLPPPAFPSDFLPGGPIRPIYFYGTYWALLPEFEKAYQQLTERP